MLDSSRFLLELTAGRTLDEYRSDRAFRSAVERELQIIGEALFQLARQAPDVAARVTESRRIISFRHVLVHGYHSLEHDLVWNIVERKLPILEKEVEVLLEEAQGEGGEGGGS